MLRTLVEATRLLSYRLAGAAIDRELLRADQQLEQYTSPFLALNALLLPWLERIRAGGELLSREELREAEVLLEQCRDALKRVARRTREIGTSIRLTYQLARMEQLLRRLELVLPLMGTEATAVQAVALLRDMIESERRLRRLSTFLGENVSLLARSVTDHAARHGEHYIAESRREWWRWVALLLGVAWSSQSWRSSRSSWPCCICLP